MLKRYFSNGPRRCERKTSVLLQCGQGLLMFSFILKILSPPVVRGGGTSHSTACTLLRLQNLNPHMLGSYTVFP
jgi:hypothetical protein